MNEPFVRGRFVFYWDWAEWRELASWPMFHCTDCCWFWLSWGPLLELGVSRSHD